LAWSSQKCFN